MNLIRGHIPTNRQNTVDIFPRTSEGKNTDLTFIRLTRATASPSFDCSGKDEVGTGGEPQLSCEVRNNFDVIGIIFKLPKNKIYGSEE